MTICKFQNGTKDYAVAVTYTTHLEEHRCQSDDLPESDLYLHAASVVHLAVELFGLKGLRAELKDIVFSSGQHGQQTRLSLRVPTAIGEDARMALPAVLRADIENAETHEVDPLEPRNAYNLAVNLLEASIAAYVQGRRQQMVFDFNAETARTLQDGVDELIASGARLSSMESFDDDDDQPGVEIPFAREYASSGAQA